MLRIGCHLSSAKGFLAMGKEAVNIGANTFQFFTRNPRGGSAKALDLEDIRNYLSFAEEKGIGNILAHAPYTLNACAKDEGLRKFAFETMQDDLRRLEHLPVKVTMLARGVSIGSDLEYTDELTLGRSILNRIPFNGSTSR